jgi:hypothetical protein
VASDQTAAIVRKKLVRASTHKHVEMASQLKLDEAKLLLKEMEVKSSSKSLHTIQSGHLKSENMEIVKKPPKVKIAPPLTAVHFSAALREPARAGEFQKTFQDQFESAAARSAKAIFESMSRAMEFGTSVTISATDYMPKCIRPRHKGAADASRPASFSPTKSSTAPLSAFWRSPVKSRPSSPATTIRSSSASTRSGMVIYVDPTVNTERLDVKLIVSYADASGLEHRMSVRVANDGGYFGLEVTGLKNGDKESFLAPTSSSFADPDSRPASAAAAASRWLPGWGGVLPVFVPSPSCNCELVVRSEDGSLLFSSELGARGPTSPPSLWSPVRKAAEGHGLKGWRASDASAKGSELAEPTRVLESINLFCFEATSYKHAIKRARSFLSRSVKADVSNSAIGGGTTALNEAALHGNVEVRGVSLSHSIDVSNVGHMQAVRYLLEVGRASPNAVCAVTGYSALHEAVFGGNAFVIKLLLKHGARVHIQDSSGSTPLHIACAHNNASATRLLLAEKSAKKALLMEDHKQKTPHQLCTSKFLRTLVEGKFVASLS